MLGSSRLAAQLAASQEGLSSMSDDDDDLHELGAGIAQSVRAGRPRGRSSSPGRVKNFLFSKSSRPNLGSTQPPIQWVPGALSPGVKRPGR
jgi:hypothetical protein